MPTATELLQQAAEAIETELAQCQRRLDLVQALLNDTPTPTPPSAPSATPPSDKPRGHKPRPRVACEGCGMQLTSNNLGRHQRRCAAFNANTDADDSTPTAPSVSDLPAGRHLACSSCDHTFPSIGKLATHTTTSHDRAPTRDERIPISA